MVELLVWGVFFLPGVFLTGLFVCIAVEEWRHDSGRPPKDFAEMRRAFRIGGLTSSLGGRRYVAVTAMGSFAERKANAAEREAIALMMRNAISKVLHKTDNGSANDVNHMMQTLAAAAPPWEAEFLARCAIRSSKVGYAVVPSNVLRDFAAAIRWNFCWT